MTRPRLLLLSLVLLAASQPAAARSPTTPRGPVVHEPIPPDPREDLALHVALEGDLPAALQTPSGLVSAPDPRQPPPAGGVAYGADGHDSFTPDRNTRRPDVAGYDDPFTPSTAPFKRLEAYDAVRPNYELYVHDPQLTPVATSATLGADDDAFYADVVVDVAPGGNMRIPSVGPGARIVRARLGVGDRDMPFRVVHDGAENWSLQAPGARPGTRARLVMEIAISRGAFGGPLADRSWADLLPVAPLPENVAHEAAEVRAAIGVSRRVSPREAIARLVQYFRGFADSEDSPRGRGSVYLDLAFSRRGVCRHRAFAFLVTAQSLGIPTRMVLNEAHAWVEVHDGVLWRRIDLGGAGRLAGASSSLPERALHRAPPDAFAWPQNADRGDEMVADARSRALPTGGPFQPGGTGAAENGGPDVAGHATSDTGGGEGASNASARDERPIPVISLAVGDPEVHRGVAIHVSGAVRADGEACAHVAVDLWLRDSKSARKVLLGTVATGDDGAFADGIVVPAGTAVGEYDVIARSHGNAQCGDSEGNRVQ
jgi:transglutaminase-like putative cysteine protease